MGAHVLLNLLNELGKSVKKRDSRIITFSQRVFDKFNNSRARMFESVYHMALRLL